MFQARMKRNRGDLSGSRLNTHSGKWIVSQFGQTKPETEYPSKRVTVRGQREINNEILANNAWAAAALKSTHWPIPPASQPLQSASDAEEEEEESPVVSQRPPAVLQAPGHANDIPAQQAQQGEIMARTDIENASTSSSSPHTSEETHNPASVSSINRVDDRLPTMTTALSSQVAALSELIQAPQREVVLSRLRLEGLQVDLTEVT
ncbi:hypothetical protein FB451DRAFT_1191105 [Mycena latifolia]|nr:hypothetical protein FB451DRAFT_1191105 [Mycena latifolia]